MVLDRMVRGPVVVSSTKHLLNEDLIDRSATSGSAVETKVTVPN